MGNMFDRAMTELSRKSGYSYNTLIDIWNEHFEETGEFPDWDYFSGVSMEHDW